MEHWTQRFTATGARDQLAQIAHTLQVPPERVFALSARDALAARIAGDDAGLARSGLPGQRTLGFGRQVVLLDFGLLCLTGGVYRRQTAGHECGLHAVAITAAPLAKCVSSDSPIISLTSRLVS